MFKMLTFGVSLSLRRWTAFAIKIPVTAFILFCYTVRYIGVTRANIFNNIRPVFTALLMLLIFNEQLPFWKWIGIVIIVVGLFISQNQRKI